MKAQGKKPVASQPTISAIPTPCHMSIVTLQNQGYLKYLISQNCDGLHRRSGMRSDMMSELHGNGNVEECEECGTRYFRDWSTYRLGRGRDHFTGRFCSKGECRGRLLEWTIDFGQSLPEDQLNKALIKSKTKTLHLVLGSSLTVSPACTMPKATKKNGGKLVICNLQKTPYYDLADINIRAPCDVLMEGIMEKLGLEIEEWVLRRKIVISIKYKRDMDNNVEAFQLSIDALDPDNDKVPATVFKKIQFQTVSGGPTQDLTGDWVKVTPQLLKAKKISIIRLHFMRHYDEPYLDINGYPLNFDQEESIQKLLLIYHPTTTKDWEIQTLDSNQQTLPFFSTLTSFPKIKIKPFNHENVNNVNLGMWADGIYSPEMNSFFVFGGSESNNISIYHCDTNQWEIVDYEQKSLLPFVNGNKRWGHTATHVPKSSKVILIGGWDSRSQYMDVHTFDIKTRALQQLKISSEKRPDCRAGHSALLVNDHQIVVYGGAICKGGPYHYYSDVWVLDIVKNTWTELVCSSLTQPPSPSSQHSATLLWNRYMLIVGGCNQSWCNSDVYCLDLKLNQWHRVEMSGDVPLPKNYKQQNFRVEAAKHFCTKLENDILLLVGLLGGCYFLDMRVWKWSKIPGENSNIVPHVGAIISDDISRDLLLLGYDHEKRKNESLSIDFATDI